MKATIEIKCEKDYQEKYPRIHNTITTHCETAQELLDALFAFRSLGHQKYIFRGQNHSHWSVIASLFRQDYFAKRVIDQSFEELGNPNDYQDQYYELFLQWEADVTAGFANDCMNQGLVLPHVPHNSLSKLRRMGDTFSYEDSSFFVARNYGLPTRLVDFTYSPLVAAWFAADGTSLTVSSRTAEKMVVWALDRRYMEIFSPWKTVSSSWANSQIPQMLRQKSVLLIDTVHKENFLETGKFQPLEFFIEHHLATHERQVTTTNSIRRFTLPHFENVFLMEKLMSNFDLSEIHLFPTLDRIARHTLSAYSQHANQLFRTQEIMQRSKSRTRPPASRDG